MTLKLKRWLISAIFVLLFCVDGMAQGFIVRGAVRDAFDNTGLENAHVLVLNSDSNVVGVAISEIPFTRIQSGNTVRNVKNANSGAAFECVVPKSGDYTAVISMMGYETKRVPIHVPSGLKKRLEMEDIYLIPQPLNLEGITVMATKLKMYHNGDTLIYNADAFVLDEQKVLEDLVKMLPGVELREGKVFANGRFVESIVISGKDVMPGNPTQLMKMLPAYTVDKLKFYDQQGEKSKTMGKDMLDANYVMDVCLKRDYHAAWIGNAEAGGGTEESWKGLGFVMRFDDRQYFSISADGNNIGRERESTDLCTVESRYEDRALTNRQVNLNYSYHPSDKLRFDVNGLARKQNSQLGTEEKHTLGLSSGSELYKLYSRTSDLVKDYYKGGMSVSLRPKKGVYGKVMYSFVYGKDSEESREDAVTSGVDINIGDSLWQQMDRMQAALAGGISNFYTDSVGSSNRARNHHAETEWHYALGDNLLRLKANYDANLADGTSNRRYANSVFDVETVVTKSRIVEDTRVEDMMASVQLEYDINYVETNQRLGLLMPYYGFSHKTEQDVRELVRLAPQVDGTEIGGRDEDNSRRIEEGLNGHTLGVNWRHEMQLRQRGWMVFDGRLPLEIKEVKVQLFHETAANRQRHQYVLFSPWLEVKWHPKADDRRGSITAVSLKGWYSETAPNERYLLNQTDTSDPMNTYLGNPELRKQREIGVALEFRHYFEGNKHTTYAKLNGTNTWDALAVQSVYDVQSGTRTLMPVNVDGKYGVSVECGYSLPLASNQTCWLDLSAGSNYIRSANMMFDNSQNQGAEFVKSYGYRTKANLRWNNSSKKLEIAYGVVYGGNGLISTTVSNDRVQELSNGLSVTGKLPRGFKASVNCNLTSRFGYAMESLNKTLVLTNAQISKSWFKEKMEFRLEAVDIFHQRKHVRLAMTSDGHIETVATQYIPAYIMATVRVNWFSSAKKKL